MKILMIGFGYNPRINDLIHDIKSFGITLYYFNVFRSNQMTEFKNFNETVDGLILTGGGTKWGKDYKRFYKYRNIESVRKRNLQFIYDCEFSDIDKSGCPEQKFTDLIDIPRKYHNVPILGICYGCNILELFYNGGLPTKLENKNTGRQITKINKSPLFENLYNKILYFDYNHYYYNKYPAPGSKIIAMQNDMSSAVQYSPIHFGIQFHIIRSGKDGEQILTNFLNICKKRANTQKIIQLFTIFLMSAGMLLTIYKR
jgi:gamma-glutamyl-gamma-aminobutyrate hydrolase PuuD